MGLLSRLRAWIGGESEAADGDAGETGGSVESDADPDGDDPGGLDPSAATETRTAATDDAVDALRDVRRSQGAGAADEDAEHATGADESDAAADRDAP